VPVPCASRSFVEVTISREWPHALASSLGLEHVRGALVSDIAEGSAGERAGLRRGDVILAVDAQPIADFAPLAIRRKNGS
jgi:S1-C subfamily serine protease